MSDFARDSIGIARSNITGKVGRVEITVGAFPRTERDMNIYACQFFHAEIISRAEVSNRGELPFANRLRQSSGRKPEGRVF